MANYYYDKYELIVTIVESWGTDVEYFDDAIFPPGATLSGYAGFTQNPTTGELIPKTPVVFYYNGHSVWNEPGVDHFYYKENPTDIEIWHYRFKDFGDPVYPDLRMGIFYAHRITPIRMQLPKYSMGPYIETIIAAGGAYPVNGRQGDYWYIRRDMVPDTPSFPAIFPRINGSIRTASDGWVRVNGQLKEITDIWVRQNGLLRKV